MKLYLFLLLLLLLGSYNQTLIDSQQIEEHNEEQESVQNYLEDQLDTSEEQQFYSQRTFKEQLLRKNEENELFEFEEMEEELNILQNASNLNLEFISDMSKTLIIGTSTFIFSIMLYLILKLIQCFGNQLEKYGKKHKLQ